LTERRTLDRISESLRIIREGEKQGAVLRMIGGLAVRAHCEDLTFCEREYGDIDLIALGRQIGKIRSIFESLGYSEDLLIARSTDGTRLLFQRDDSQDHVDVFLDKLRMEHTIDLRDRLQIERLTISVSDILVTKLIIHVMNEKDYRDIFTIMKDMEFSHDDTPGVINVNYLANICSKNWGLFQDVYSKIDACFQLVSHFNLNQSDCKLIQTRFLSIKEAMDNKPKSLKWKLRALMGNRIAIREIVEEEDLQTTTLSSELSKSERS
jgi:hypothetical protein